eukprot:Nk52_evm5s2284 gene=Nk52_evmTU5s2284
MEGVLDCHGREYGSGRRESNLFRPQRLEASGLGFSNDRGVVRSTHVRRDGDSSEHASGTILHLGPGPGLSRSRCFRPRPLEGGERIHQSSVADDRSITPLVANLPGTKGDDTCSARLEKPAMVAAVTGATGTPTEVVAQGPGVIPISEAAQPATIGPPEMGDGGLSDQDGAIALNTGDDAGEFFNDLAGALLSEADAKKTKKARKTTQARFLEWRREQHATEERAIQLGDILAYLTVKTAKRSLYKRCPITVANELPTNVEDWFKGVRNVTLRDVSNLRLGSIAATAVMATTGARGSDIERIDLQRSECKGGTLILQVIQPKEDTVNSSLPRRTKPLYVAAPPDMEGFDPVNMVLHYLHRTERFKFLGTAVGRPFIPGVDEAVGLCVAANNTTRPVKRATISGWIRTEFARYQVDFKRTNDIRAWVITKLLKQECSMRMVADLVNHTTTRTIERHYKRVNLAQDNIVRITELLQK